MTHAELLASMSQDEFTYWLALESIDPLYDPWVGNAVNCQVTAATYSKRTPKLEHFLPVKQKRRKQSEQQLLASMRRFVVNKKNAPE